MISPGEASSPWLSELFGIDFKEGSECSVWDSLEVPEWAAQGLEITTVKVASANYSEGAIDLIVWIA